MKIFDKKNNFSDKLIVFSGIIFISIFSYSQENIKVKFHQEYDYIEALDKNFKTFDNKNGFAIMQKGDLPNETYVITDNKGNIITKDSLLACGLYNNNLALVKNKNHKYGFINKSGDLVIPCVYEYAYDFSDEIATVKRKGMWGAINRRNEVVIPFKYFSLKKFTDGISICSNKESKSAFINKKGKLTSKFLSDLNIDDYKEKLGIVSLNGKFGVIENNGKIIVDYKYDFIWPYNEGVALVKLNNKYGFINKKGNLTIPLIYDDALSFSEGLAPVLLKSEGNSWGYIDKKGNIKIPFKFNGFIARPFKESFASVYMKKGSGFINKKGDFVIKPIYNNTSSFKNGLAQVETFDSRFFINVKGEKVIDLSPDEIVMEEPEE